MGRVIGIDYGLRRVGLATTDPLQMIATALDTIPNKNVFKYLQDYLQKEEVDGFVVGMPLNLKGLDTDATKGTRNFIKKLKKTFPQKFVEEQDEQYTSKMAVDAMVKGGTSKKYRRNKGNIDRVSAVLILQSYLAHS